MLQIYLCSVVCLALSGWLLFKSSGDVFSFESVFGITGEPVSLRFGVGIAAVITGALTLLSPIEGDVPVAGDLIPAVVSAVGGLTLIKEQVVKDNGSVFASILEIFSAHRRQIGIVSIIVSILHFLLPRALFL
ncbi:MAG: hypothetical protein LBD20_09915 [Spirochaetaceae bacterium]|nr:hypothetical protein [Spirochaetaceae bacterium]